MATLYVAASNSSSKDQSFANYLGNGTTSTGTTTNSAGQVTGGDQAVIQAAITALGGAGIVHLLPGSYFLGASVTLATGVVLEGTDRNLVTLLPQGAYPAVSGNGVSNVTVRTLGVDGTSQPVSGSTDDTAGIYVLGSSGVLVADCLAHHTVHCGIELTGCSNAEIRGCEVHHAGNGLAVTGSVGSAHGIWVQGAAGSLTNGVGAASKVRVRGNYVHDCVQQFAHGITVQTGSTTSLSDVTVDDNQVINCGQPGNGGGGGIATWDNSGPAIGSESLANLVVTGNLCRDCNDGALFVVGQSVTISGNALHTESGTVNATGPAIEITQTSVVAVTGNRLHGYNSGIWIHGGTQDFTVTGNVVSAATNHGVLLQEAGTRYGSVSGNQIGPVGQSAVYLQDTAGDMAVSGNVCRNSNSGIWITSTSNGGATWAGSDQAGTQVTGNTVETCNYFLVIDAQNIGTATSYGPNNISEVNNMVRNCTNIIGGTTAGRTNMIWGNWGGMRHDSGTCTITGNGATLSFLVNFNFTLPYGVGGITLTPTNAAAAALTNYYTDINAGSTSQFKIIFATAPATGTYTFAWFALSKPTG